MTGTIAVLGKEVCFGGSDRVGLVPANVSQKSKPAGLRTCYVHGMSAMKPMWAG